MDDPCFYGFPTYGEAGPKAAQDVGGRETTPAERTFERRPRRARPSPRVPGAPPAGRGRSADLHEDVPLHAHPGPRLRRRPAARPPERARRAGRRPRLQVRVGDRPDPRRARPRRGDAVGRRDRGLPDRPADPARGASRHVVHGLTAAARRPPRPTLRPVRRAVDPASRPVPSSRHRPPPCGGRRERPGRGGRRRVRSGRPADPGGGEPDAIARSPVVRSTARRHRRWLSRPAARRRRRSSAADPLVLHVGTIAGPRLDEPVQDRLLRRTTRSSPQLRPARRTSGTTTQPVRGLRRIVDGGRPTG